MPYWCDSCDRGFGTEQGRDAHCRAKGHRRPPRYYCDPCNRAFNTEFSYDQHCLNAAAHRTCNICDVVLGSIERLEKHKRKVHQSSLVRCHFCDRTFKSPSAYAQHIECGVHGVSRYQVTQAIHTLRVVPQITIAQDFEYRNSRIEPYEYDDSGIEAIESDPFEFRGTTPTQATQAPEDITGEPDIVGPGPPLGPREMEVALAPPRLAAPVLISPGYQYFPNDFINIGIPYACPICLKTFRNAFALTAHMNSPVHDPDAFKCPKCKRQFALVSGLIQHLESGSCKLASPAEIYTRFAKLTAQFSRLLT